MSQRLYMESSIVVDLPEGLTDRQAIAAALGVDAEWSGWPDGSTVNVTAARVTLATRDSSNGAGIERRTPVLDDQGRPVS